MLCHVVGVQRPCRHLLSAIPECNPLSLPLPERRSFSRHEASICLLRPISRGAAWSTSHAYCFPAVGVKSHPVKQPHKMCECPLHPLGVGRREHAVVRVEQVGLVPALPPPFPPFSASVTAIVTQWRTTASTTALKMVGDSGSPCVTPLPPLKPFL